MKRTGLVLLAFAVLATGWFGYRFLFPSDTIAIERELRHLAEDLSFSRGEGNIARAWAVQKASSKFASNALVRVYYEHRRYEIARPELEQSLMAARSGLHSLHLSLIDLTVQFDQGGNSAHARMTLMGEVDRDPEPMIQQLDVELRKINGDWRISRVESRAPE